MTTQRKSKIISTDPVGWTVSTEMFVNGRHVRAGTKLSFRGERGKFTFIRQVTTDTSSWVDVVGGTSGVRMFRSFRPDRIKTVHQAMTQDERARAKSGA